MSPTAWRVVTGDCLDVLATLEPDSVDACVTDPPYGISFMGREWDTFTPATVEKMRTPKAFGADEVNPNLRGRTGWAGSAAIAYDRSAAASLKFEAWTQQWAEAVLRVLKPGAHAVVCASPRMGHRVTCGLEDAGFEIRDSLLWLTGQGFPKSLNLPGGLGTGLKPGYESIILARKPLGGRTVAQCVAEYGTGALNIDGCRLQGGKPWSTNGGQGPKTRGIYGHMRNIPQSMHDLGRWPPNVALDEDAAAMLDAEGGTSRFFYCPKASRDERERGCEDLPRKTAGDATDRQDGSAGLNSPRAGASRTHGARNVHPTVKPVALMRWLVRLVTPPGGLVLDPFAGSGTTGIACVQEQMRFLGIEREAEYVPIAAARIGAAVAQFQTGGPLFAAFDTPDAPRLATAEVRPPCA